jgi:hypothetical protein
MHRDVMANGDQSAVAFGAQTNPLLRHRAQTDQMKDLLPGHRNLDRLVQSARGERREDRFRVDAELGAESAADVW